MFHTICLACIIIGILIPFLTIVLNIFDGFVDFVSIDFFQLDIDGDFFVDFLPLSVNSLCLWALLFGCFGFVCEGKLPFVLVIVIGLLIGYVGAVILQSMIGKLRKIESYAPDKEELLMKNGVVSNAITENGMGAVSVITTSGTSVSYPAKSFDNNPIVQDKEVEIIEVHNEYVIVRSLTYMEDKYKGGSNAN